MGRDTDREVTDLAHEMHELDRVVELAVGSSRPFGGSPPRARMLSTPASRYRVTIVDELGVVLRYTREVRHRATNVCRSLIANHEIVRALAGGTACWRRT